MQIIVIGQKGSGKSYCGMMEVLHDWLLEQIWDPETGKKTFDPRPIIVFGDLKLGKFRREMRRRYGFDIKGRVHLRPPFMPGFENECRRFFEDRGNGERLVFESITDPQTGYQSWRPVVPPRYGVRYIVDECDKFFRSEDYRLFQGKAQWWFSYERQLADDGVFITQDTQSLDRVIVRKCNEFWWMVNAGKMRVRKMVMPQVHTVTRYTADPTEAGSNAKELEPRVFKRKQWLADCYRTDSASGGKSGADKGKRPKGIPVVYGVAGMALASVIFMLAPIVVVPRIARGMTGKRPAAHEIATLRPPYRFSPTESELMQAPVLLAKYKPAPSPAPVVTNQTTAEPLVVALEPPLVWIVSATGITSDGGTIIRWSNGHKTTEYGGTWDGVRYISEAGYLFDPAAKIQPAPPPRPPAVVTTNATKRSPFLNQERIRQLQERMLPHAP